MPDGAVITPDEVIDNVEDGLEHQGEAVAETSQPVKKPLIPDPGTTSIEQSVTRDAYASDEEADKVREQLEADKLVVPESISEEQKAIREYTGILDKVATAIKMRSNPKDSSALSQDVYYADQLLLDEALLPSQLEQMGLTSLAQELRIAENLKHVPDINESIATRTLKALKENIGLLKSAKPEDVPFTGFRIFNNPGSGLLALSLDTHYTKDSILFRSDFGFLNLRTGRGVRSGDHQALDPDNFNGEGHAGGAEKRHLALARDVETLTDWAITNNKANTKSSDSIPRPQKAA